MSPRLEVPADTLARQLRVSDPKASAWVSANAGSGKTTVLVRRVIRLLLDGNPPGRILCLTFTKAAAANMANKVLGTLAEWVRLDDKEMDKRLAAVTPLEITPALRAKARRLFAEALETPGGLKVQTIHAFCDRVLHQFPFEAKVPAGFEVLDDLREEELLRRAREEVIVEASRDADGALGQALAIAIASAADESLVMALAECVRARRKVKEASELGPDVLARALGLKQAISSKDVLGEILNQGLPQSEWKNIAACLRDGSKSDQECADRFLEALAASNVRRAESYANIFLTEEGKPRSRLVTKEFTKKHAGLASQLGAEHQRVSDLIAQLRIAQAFERTSALLTLAQAVIEKFELAKRERGALDYGDLIGKTADMLNDLGSAWVLYKLDGGIDHVLVDEAQDTSPEQWSVISKLTEEFFAGKGARENRKRTIFAVGDEKQSIFSFQGADPGEFARQQTGFKKLVEGAGSQFNAETLNLSFRSAPVVLKAVDAVFSRPEASNRVSSTNSVPPHEAIRSKAPALVELWDTERPEPDDAEKLPWDAPIDAQSEKSPVVSLAQRIALAVKLWTDGGHAIEDSRTHELRAPNAGDVIVLVRRRGPLFDAILQALKAEGLPVAGADRLKLYDHIAVMDLVALGDALMLEADDLALACALKSPLFNFSEADLYSIAQGRTGSLADSLREHAKTNQRLAYADALLSRWRMEAATLRPFDFYSRVLGRDRGREKMLARLGHEAADALDEFLARALVYEQIETPSLGGFLHFLRRAGTEVKRDLEVQSNAVRVMTVHGAKGLEAPIVILADSTTIPDGKNTRLHDIPGSRNFVWAGSKKLDSPVETVARDAATEAREAEYRRLLYVALTRAADALVVCGVQGKNDLDPGCWYCLVRDALEAGEPAELAAVTTPYGEVRRWRAQVSAAAPRRAIPPLAPTAIPEALERNALAPKDPVKRIRPSDLDHDDAIRMRAGSGSRATALRRGDLLHRLMELLPQRKPDERKQRALQFLKSAAADMSGEEQEKLASEAEALLLHPGMAPLLGARSLPEVPFLHRTPSGEVSGRIDRLFEKDGEIILLDYKTDANPPKNAAEIPESHRRQLGLYRDALARMYPGRTIRPIVAYSRGPFVHELGAVDGGSPRRDAP